MRIILLYVCLLAFSINANCQNLNGAQLLEKAINFHDPQGNWDSFNGTLNITMETPDNSNRDTEVVINLPEEYFHAIVKRDSITTKYLVNKGECIISKSDSLRIAKAKTKPKRTHCETSHLYKDYYTYLYGLPMKLKDKGTIIHDKVERQDFKGKNYLVLKVSYDQAVGSDVWYFYFNPETYAMEVYQFFKTDENGNIKEDSGEYILLSDLKTINNIKMPKIRSWYYNKNDKFLGTDILN